MIFLITSEHLRKLTHPFAQNTISRSCFFPPLRLCKLLHPVIVELSMPVYYAHLIFSVVLFVPVTIRLQNDRWYVENIISKAFQNIGVAIKAENAKPNHIPESHCSILSEVLTAHHCQLFSAQRCQSGVEKSSVMLLKCTDQLQKKKASDHKHVPYTNQRRTVVVLSKIKWKMYISTQHYL